MGAFVGNFVSIVSIMLLLVKLGYSLDLRDVQEGSCRGIRNVPTVGNINGNFLDRLTYIPGGSKYQLYRHARGHPHFPLLREFKFFYEACLYKNMSLEDGSGSTFGFGDQRLVSYNLRGRNTGDETGVISVSTERPGIGINSGDTFTSKVTLTDNRNFAVLVHCWEGVNQRAWSVYSRPYVLSRATRRRVEDHVVGLGFDRDNVAFLEYQSCRYDEDYDDIDQTSVGQPIFSNGDKKGVGQGDKTASGKDKTPFPGDKMSTHVGKGVASNVSSKEKSQDKKFSDAANFSNEKDDKQRRSFIDQDKATSSHGDKRSSLQGDKISQHPGNHGDKHTGSHGDKHTGRNHGDKHTGNHSDKHTGNHGDKHTGNHGDKHTGHHSDKHIGNHSDKHTGNHSDKNTGNNGDKHTGSHGDKHTGNHGDKHTGNHGDKHTGNHKDKDSKEQSGRHNVKSRFEHSHEDNSHEISDLKSGSRSSHGSRSRFGWGSHR